MNLMTRTDLLIGNKDLTGSNVGLFSDAIDFHSEQLRYELGDGRHFIIAVYAGLCNIRRTGMFHPLNIATQISLSNFQDNQY